MSTAKLKKELSGFIIDPFQPLIPFFEEFDQRRTVREFSDRPVPREVIENLICTASTAPSGANKQPWTYCVIESQAIKSAIRKAAEKEEQVQVMEPPATKK